MRHGTFRNKISELKKEGDVKVTYRSVQTFYTMRGHKFGRPMTPEESAFLKVLSEENSAIQRALLEIKMMFEKFTAEKKQYWKDEQLRRREATWK